MSIESSDSGIGGLAYSERTLAIIKPEAHENAEDIENHIRHNGFIILAKREVRLTPENAAEFYKGHYGRHHFPHLVAHMSSGPIIVLVLAAKNCIHKWRTLMGPARVVEAQAYWPDSLRACYGRRTKYGDYFNAVHGSASLAEAVREIHFFFPTRYYRSGKELGVLVIASWSLSYINAPMQEFWRDTHFTILDNDYSSIYAVIVGPVLRGIQVRDYIQKHITPTLLPALTALAQERPAEPIIWLADHLQRHNPNEPELAPQAREMKEEARCQTPLPSEESLVK